MQPLGPLLQELSVRKARFEQRASVDPQREIATALMQA